MRAAACLVVAVTLLAVSGTTLSDVYFIKGAVHDMAANAQDGDEKVATWEDADCVMRTVKTVRGDESMADFCKRHDEAVAHDMQIYGVKPPDAGADGPPRWLVWYLKRNPDALLTDTPWR